MKLMFVLLLFFLDCLFNYCDIEHKTSKSIADLVALRKVIRLAPEGNR